MVDNVPFSFERCKVVSLNGTRCVLLEHHKQRRHVFNNYGSVKK